MIAREIARHSGITSDRRKEMKEFTPKELETRHRF